ncbi:MAG TPA: hypothetical protein VM553_00580 [Dongiaceae bacterium]|nr:hypothetical protein [Dongiaceae bacterium]
MMNIPLLHDVRVFDASGAHLVGHLVHMDDDGLDMLADQPLDEARELTFMLDDITAFEPGKKVTFSAICDYCNPDDEALDVYHVHLNFTHLSAHAREVTNSLL